MTGKIVVGVDGSAASDEALRWAAGEARRNGDRIVAVNAWSYPVMIGGVFAASSGFDAGFDDLEVWAKQTLADSVHRVMGDHNRIGVEEVVTHGSAAQVLLELAQDADLLVVGTSGHGTVAGLVLGSISLHCATHATCPVVLVPPPRSREEDDR